MVWPIVSQILGRVARVAGQATVDAYKQALKDAKKGGGIAGVMGRSMAPEEAMAILNLKPKTPPAEIDAQFAKLNAMNNVADGGSPYLASKLSRARTVLVPSSWAPAAEEPAAKEAEPEAAAAEEQNSDTAKAKGKAKASGKADAKDSAKKAGGSAKDIPSGGISWKEMRKRRQEAMGGGGKRGYHSMSTHSMNHPSA